MQKQFHLFNYKLIMQKLTELHDSKCKRTVGVNEQTVCEKCTDSLDKQHNIGYDWI